jgi:hypothetical protein
MLADSLMVIEERRATGSAGSASGRFTDATRVALTGLGRPDTTTMHPW